MTSNIPVQCSQTIFYKLTTRNIPCTVTLEEYLDLCANCPEGFEQSLQETTRPAQLHFHNQAALRAILNNKPVMEPVAVFSPVEMSA
jgi:hypothetical protein